MKSVKGVDKVGQFFIDLLYPKFCLGCKKEGAYLCADCKATLDISEHRYCLCSNGPLRLPPESSGKCPRCQDKKLSGLLFALPYKERFLTKKLIHQFKYKPYVKDLSGTLAKIIQEHIFLADLPNDFWQNGVLVPVPMELSKQKDRGYNQSEELAKELSKIFGIPMLSSVLVKIKKTEQQMKLSAKERQENLVGAFAIKNPAEIAGKKIFLADDVYTTGVTMAECAKILKAAGAKKVWGIAIAREG